MDAQSQKHRGYFFRPSAYQIHNPVESRAGRYQIGEPKSDTIVRNYQVKENRRCKEQNHYNFDVNNPYHQSVCIIANE